jgi:voltage-gated potassium channel Kch
VRVEDARALPGDRAGYLVIGNTPLSKRICQELAGGGDHVDHLVQPADDVLAEGVRRRPVAVAVVVHDDVLAVRYALATAHLDPTLRMLVTIFDRTIADHVARLLPQAVVTSPAGIAAPSLAGPCLGSDVVAAWEADGVEHRVVQAGGDRVHRTAPRRSRGDARVRVSQLMLRLGVQDLSARLMVGGLLGLLTVLAVDFVWLMVDGHHGVADAFLESARVVATVGPGPTDASAAYATFSAIAMLCCVGFTALFTAGLVDRLLEPGLVSLLGTRSAPRRDHVIVVGMGQVGIRLCTELRRLGVPVVGVERDLAAPQLHVARALRIPVVTGHGGDREVLERVGLRRALALAAVGSDENDNIAVAIAANAIAPGTRVVLRAGEQEAIAETRSLLPLGVTRDVWSIAAARVVDVLRDGSGADPVARLLDTSADDAVLSADHRQPCRHAVMT